MTREHLEWMVRVHGPKTLLVLRLSDHTEMEMRGNLFSIAQLDLFRDRVRFSAPWTEVLISVADIESVAHDGRRLRVTMRTNAVTMFPSP